MVARLNDKTELTERLNFVEHQLELAMVEIEENDNWIDDFEPPANVIDAIKRVRELEIKIKELEVLVYIGKR